MKKLKGANHRGERRIFKKDSDEFLAIDKTKIYITLILLFVLVSPVVASYADIKGTLNLLLLPIAIVGGVAIFLSSWFFALFLQRIDLPTNWVFSSHCAGSICTPSISATVILVVSGVVPLYLVSCFISRAYKKLRKKRL